MPSTPLAMPADALVAAALTPITTSGDRDERVTAGYLESLLADGARGLAVAVHTGRGAGMPMDARAGLIRRAATLSPIVVTGIWAGDDVERAAGVAAAAGATALLMEAAHPHDAAREVERLDVASAASGLPLIAFDLYARPYGRHVRQAVLAHAGVHAYKPALLHDAIACQEGIDDAVAAAVIVLTGEDRMFVPSLLWGATGALVGIAAAATPVTARALAAVSAGADDVAAASRALDALARVTFRPPFDGYVQRMAWVAADEGRIPWAYAIDPARPSGLRDGERDHVLAVARALRGRVDI